jgi:hypothetical protein
MAFDINTARPVDETQRPQFPIAKSAALGVGQGASLGWGDEGAGAIAGAAVDLANFRLPRLNSYRNARNSFRDTFKNASEANPKTFLAGEIAGAAATSFVPGMQGTTLPRLAAIGAVQGLGSSESEDLTGTVADTVTGAVLGGTIGGITPPILRAGGSVFKTVTPKTLRDFAGDRAAKALGATKRFLKTRKMEVEARKTGQSMLDQGVVKPFSSAEKMAESVSELQKKTGKDIGSFLKAQGNGFETKSAIRSIESLRPRNTKGDVLEGGEYDRINAIIDKARATVEAHGDVIPFEVGNEIKTMLQKLVNYNSDKAEQELRKGIAGAYKDSLDKSLKQSAFSQFPKPIKLSAGQVGLKTPGFDEFLENKKVYGASSRAEDYLENRLSSERGNKSIGLTDWILAAGGVGAGALTNPWTALGGLSAVAAKKGAEKYGNQMLAVGANEASKVSQKIADKLPFILKHSAATLGKYAPVLQQAAARGAQQLALTHSALVSTDPEYQKLLAQFGDGEVSVKD